MEKQISITKIKIRHSQILLFLNCPKKPETLQGELRFQNAWLNSVSYTHLTLPTTTVV